MTNHEPDDDYFERQFSAIQSNIADQTSRRRERRRWLIPVTGGVATLVLTGGAIAIVQASHTEKSVSICYSAPSLTSDTAEVGTSDDDASVSTADTMPERVELAQNQCDALWRIGTFSTGGQADGTKLTAPPLFTCMLRDGRLGVFPETEGVTCESLDLTEP